MFFGFEFFLVERGQPGANSLDNPGSIYGYPELSRILIDWAPPSFYGGEHLRAIHVSAYGPTELVAAHLIRPAARGLARVCSQQASRGCVRNLVGVYAGAIWNQRGRALPALQPPLNVTILPIG